MNAPVKIMPVKKPENPLIEWVTSIEDKAALIEKYLLKLDANIAIINNDLKTEAGRSVRAMEFSEKKAASDQKGINSLVELIESKEYNPEIVVENKAITDFLSEVLDFLNEVKQRLSVKRTWVHTIERDSAKLIKSITSVSQ